MANNSRESINKKINDLDELIEYFESSEKQFDLDIGIKKYEEAIKIVKELKKSLKSYELKIKELDAVYLKDEEVEED
jgi:exonuclease VII small subunit